MFEQGDTVLINDNKFIFLSSETITMPGNAYVYSLGIITQYLLFKTNNLEMYFFHDLKHRMLHSRVVLFEKSYNLIKL